MEEPLAGERVHVWPEPALRVQDGPGNFNVFLPQGGRDVAWGEYWHRRLADGSIHLHDPRRKAAPEKPTRPEPAPEPPPAPDPQPEPEPPAPPAAEEK